MKTKFYSTKEERERRKKYEQKYHLKTKYGLTVEQHEMMNRAQGGRCAICQRNHDRLCVDHSHITGKVRGLLCDGCNRALGQLKDNKATLQLAIEYLNKYDE